MATGRPFEGREVPVMLARAPGAPPEERLLDLIYVQLPSADADAPKRVLGYGTDVTEHVHARRRAEAALAERTQAAEVARGDADRANRARSEFLATMSHELRTPLNAIGGYTELMELGIYGPLTVEQRQAIGRIQASQRHLIGLVDEVLDLSKIDAGAVVANRVPVPVGGTVDAAVALVRPQAVAKGITLSERCEVPGDLRYLGDEARVRQILVNLLGNAVKFTPNGGHVTVVCTLGNTPPMGLGAPASASQLLLALRVADTGVGIASDEQERIFEPFTQAGVGANPYTRATGGTGLGLTISRRLARLMEGELTLESTPGTGSTFTLWLPYVERRGQDRPLAVASAAEVDDRRVDDQPVEQAVQRHTAADPDVLAQLGEALLGETGPVVRAWIARLEADASIPKTAADGRRITEVELEDHAATFVTDIALALRTLAHGGADVGLMRDGTAILGMVAERHGAQRARLRWPEAAVHRELAVLGEILDATLQRLAAAHGNALTADALGGAAGGAAGDAAGDAAGRPAAVMQARTVVQQLVERGTRVSVGGYRLTQSSGEPAEA